MEGTLYGEIRKLNHVAIFGWVYMSYLKIFWWVRYEVISSLKKTTRLNIARKNTKLNDESVTLDFGWIEFIYSTFALDQLSSVTFCSVSSYFFSTVSKIWPFTHQTPGLLILWHFVVFPVIKQSAYKLWYFNAKTQLCRLIRNVMRWL